MDGENCAMMLLVDIILPRPLGLDYVRKSRKYVDLILEHLFQTESPNNLTKISDMNRSLELSSFDCGVRPISLKKFLYFIDHFNLDLCYLHLVI